MTIKIIPFLQKAWPPLLRQVLLGGFILALAGGVAYSAYSKANAPSSEAQLRSSLVAQGVPESIIAQVAQCQETGNFSLQCLYRANPGYWAANYGFSEGSETATEPAGAALSPDIARNLAEYHWLGTAPFWNILVACSLPWLGVYLVLVFVVLAATLLPRLIIGADRIGRPYAKRYAVAALRQGATFGKDFGGMTSFQKASLLLTVFMLLVLLGIGLLLVF